METKRIKGCVKSKVYMMDFAWTEKDHQDVLRAYNAKRGRKQVKPDPPDEFYDIFPEEFK
jgi:hypothetical protein